MNKDKIIDIYWFTGFKTVGAVAFKTFKDGNLTGGWRATIGSGDGIDEESDTLFIANEGCKVNKPIATAMFPHLDANNFVI